MQCPVISHAPHVTCGTVADLFLVLFVSIASWEAEATSWCLQTKSFSVNTPPNRGLNMQLRGNKLGFGDRGASYRPALETSHRAQLEELEHMAPSSEFASVEHRLIHQSYPKDSATAKSLLWEGALGNWPGETRTPDPSVYGENHPYVLDAVQDPRILRSKIMSLKTRWNKDTNLVGALALLLAGTSQSAKETRRRHGLDGKCRPLPSTYTQAWERLALGLKRKYSLQRFPRFRQVLLSRATNGKLPILIESDTNALGRPSFWAGQVHQSKLYGENAGGVLLSKIRSALLWSAVRSNCGYEFLNCQQQELVELAKDAEDLYIAGLGYVRADEPDVTAYGKLSEFDSPIPAKSDLHALGFQERCTYREVQKGVFARDLAPIELRHPVAYFRSKAKMPWALLSNFAYVPWGA